MNVLQHLIRGAGTLPNFGPHPGTAFLIGFPALAFVATLGAGVYTAAMSCLFTLCWMFPLWAAGAISRSRGDTDEHC